MTEVNDPFANNVTINIPDPANSYIVVVRANERCRRRIDPRGRPYGCPAKTLRPIPCTVEYNPRDTGIGTGTQQEAERIPDQTGGPNTGRDPTVPPRGSNRPGPPPRRGGPSGSGPERRGGPGGSRPDRRGGPSRSSPDRPGDPRGSRPDSRGGSAGFGPDRRGARPPFRGGQGGGPDPRGRDWI